MKTGYYELDNFLNLNKAQLIACSSLDHVIESFFINVLKNTSIDQKIPVLYIDNNLMRDCTENIKKEREIIFENKNHEMEIVPMLMEISDNTLDDIVSSITMLDRYKIMDNRIAEGVYTKEEIRNFSKKNTVELIDIIDDKKYISLCKLFNIEEREKIRETDLLLKSSPLFLEHIEKISLNSFKKLCYKYKANNKVNLIIINNINTIINSNEVELLNELQEMARKLNIPIIIGYDLRTKNTISLENELENIKQKCKYLDTILFLKDGIEEEKNILQILILKNINNKLGKISLLFLDKYRKYIDFKKNT